MAFAPGVVLTISVAFQYEATAYPCGLGCGRIDA